MSDTITQWLEKLGLDRYAVVFAEQEIVFEDLVELTDADLKDLGIPLGPRKRFLKAFATLTEAQPALDKVRSEVPESEGNLAAWERHPGERKPVTMLFADITDSTTITGKLDPEEAHDLLYGATQRMCEAVENNQGTVCKLMGDGVMAMFGAPMASEHHAVEACAAALEMQHAIDDYGNNIIEGKAKGIRIRVGLHSGEVVVLTVGEGDKVEYDASGPTVPIAARMEQTAEPGEIYITAATYSLAENRIEADILEPVMVKGISEPVQALTLRRVRPVEEANLDRARTPFVGRRAELNQFKGLLDTCIEDGNGQTVCVRGEPGIGKTRLIEEFTKIAVDKEVATHRGLVLPFGVGKGQDAIRSLLRSLLGIAAGSDKEVRRRIAAEALSDHQVKPDRAVFINDLLDLSQPPKLRAIYDAMDNSTRNAGKQAVVSELVNTISKRQPILVIVEDVHWADAITLAHLATITRTVAECPALLVLTSRIDGDQLDQGWRSTTEGSAFFTIDLGPLRKQDSITLISEFISSADPLAQNCLERAAGNPLFLEQLLRSVHEGTTEGLPDSIQSLVLTRIDRLVPEDKFALQVASIIGQRFDSEALCSISGMADFSCQALIEHNLVRPEGGGFLFTHALIQESIYGSLVKSQRRALHRKAAQWFASSDLVLHAEHLAQAGDEGTAEAFLEAAVEQTEHYRLEKALELVERGLANTTEGVSFSLQYLQGELLRSLGLPKKSIAIYRKAKETATSDIDRCRASVGIAEGLRIIEAHDELLNELQFAEAVVNSQDHTLELARIYQLRGGVFFIRGEAAACIEANRIALQYAEAAGSLEVMAQTLSGLGDAEYLRGRMISANRYFDQCVEICRKQGLGITLAVNLAMLGAVSRWQGKFALAVEYFEEAVALAQETGQSRAEMVALFSGECFAEWGDLEKGEQWLKRRLKLARRLGNRSAEGMTIAGLSRIAYLRGFRNKAEKLVQEAIDILRDGAMAFAGPQALGLLALVTQSSSRRRAALSEGEQLLRGDCISHNFLVFYTEAMETCLQTGEWDEVGRYAQALEDYTSSEPLPQTSFFIARGRVLANFGRGNREPAMMRELQQLRDEAEHINLVIAIPALEAALSSTWAAPGNLP